MKNEKGRNITFKPTCRSFGPMKQIPSETMSMSEDELEALYLADFQGRYQEECAKLLGVSRPTFAKIIKRARKKCAEMLMFAKGIELEHTRRSFTVAFATNDRISIHPHFITARYYALAKVDGGSITSITYVDNPVFLELARREMDIVDDDSAKGMAAGRIIPPLLKKANIVLARTLGEGIQRNLEGSGLNVELTEEPDIDQALTALG